MTAESVDQEIAYWTKRLGLDGLSTKRPAFLEPSLLQLHQWVRAFIGKPSLVILERPMHSVSNSELPKLIAATNDLRRRGSSVIWLTSDRSLGSDRFSPAAFPYEVRNEKLLQMMGDSKHE
jgi:phospholipid/cholesterol/gamma-HCH transport system ATP-binding protein